METIETLKRPSDSTTHDEEKSQARDRSSIGSPAFSCLSPLVSRLILLESSTKQDFKASSRVFFSEGKRMDWEKLSKDQLSKAPQDDDFSFEDANEVDRIWFYAARNTQKIAIEAESTLRGTSVAQIQELFPKALSMSFAPHLTRVHQEFLDTGNTLLAFSAMCTFLERSLSDLFSAVEESRQANAKLRRKPPPLLKDLLQMSEMEEVLGVSMFLLQVLIGSPRALNLRNIIWHGFVAPHELDSGFYWLLLWLMLDIFERDFPGISFIPAREMKDLSRIAPETYDFGIGGSSTLHLAGKDETVTATLRQELTTLLSRSSFILPHRAQNILSAYDYYTRGELDSYGYYFCLVLAMPVLEHCLRHQWVEANGLPPQLLCADSFRYYTVMDMFLETHLHPFMSVEALTTGSMSGPSSFSSTSGNPLPTTSEPARANLLPERLGKRILIALNDTFIYPLGPRPRDRISHGDVHPTSVTRLAAARCLEIIIYLALKCQPPSSQITPPILESCAHFYDNYVSCWHPHSLLERQLHKTSNQSWRQFLVTALSIPSSIDEASSTQDESTDEPLLRRLGYSDETHAAFDALHSIHEYRSSKSPTHESVHMVDFLSLETFDSGISAIPTEDMALQLTFFDSLDSPSQATSSFESARKVCFELDSLLSQWNSKIVAQLEQIRGGQASKRLEASFHKQLLVLDLAIVSLAAILLFCESHLHSPLLDPKSTRNLLTSISQLRIKIENNAWDESVALLTSALNLMLKLMS